MLELDSVTKSYGSTRAVDGVTLSVPDGQMLGIIGGSGAGKSTTLRTINRLTPPSTGQVRFDGGVVSDLRGAALRDWRSRCAMIFQQFNLIERLDVVTNVLIGRITERNTLCVMFKHFTRAQRAEAVRALDRLGLASLALRRADTLSGGQQQRVAIARALLQRPRLILADEPVASLDPRHAHRVMQTLRQINRQERITVLVNLHDLAIARQYCDRLVGMSHGRIVFDGPPEALTPEAQVVIYGHHAEPEATSDASAEPPTQPGRPTSSNHTPGRSHNVETRAETAPFSTA